MATGALADSRLNIGAFGSNRAGDVGMKAYKQTNGALRRSIYIHNLASVLPVYANNAAAVAGGLIAGEFYRTGADPDPVVVVH